MNKHLITFKLYLGGKENSSHVDSIPVHLKKRIITIIIVIIIINIINIIIRKRMTIVVTLTKNFPTKDDNS